MPPSFSAHGSPAEHTTDTLRPPPASQPTDAIGLYESGIPPGGTLSRTLAARGEAHAQAAVAACTRAEANLGALLRTVQHVAAVVSSAREAKGEAIQELERLRTLLNQADEEQLSLRHRVALLEQTLERTERESARERAFLIDEQDTFIAGLWEEHALEVTELSRRLASLEESLAASREETQSLQAAAHAAGGQGEELLRRLRKAEADLKRFVSESDANREVLMRLQTEREEALLAASQTARERDHLKAELGRARSASSARPITLASELAERADAPIPLVTRSESSRIPLAKIELGELDRQWEPPAPSTSRSSAETRTRTPSPSAVAPPSESPSALRGSAMRRAAEAPEELRAAITEADPSPRSSASSSRSALRTKPDPSSRPLIGYSLAGDDVPLDVESVRSSSRPPSR